MTVRLHTWIVLSCVVLAIPSCAAWPDPEVLVVEDFEEGLEWWTTGSDVPEDPNNPGHPVAWSVTPSDEQASGGDYSAEFYLDGRQDDGTIWLAREFELDNEGTYHVNILVDFWSLDASFNTLAKVAFYAGTAEPAEEEDFDISQAANLEAGWHTYVFGRNVTVGQGETLWIAFGISAVWETELTYFFDNVVVSLTPLD